MHHTIFTFKKFTLFLILAGLLYLAYYGYTLYGTLKKEDIPPVPETPPMILEENTPSFEPKIISQEMTTEEDAELPVADKHERADILTKKAELLTTQNEYTEALALYERAMKLSPSTDIERKLAHAAFKAKKFQKSADYFKKNVDILTTGEKIEFLNALRYTGDDDFMVALANLNLPDYVGESFEVSRICETEFISCENAIRSYKHDYAPMRDLKNALGNYGKLGNNDVNYKEALLIGAWYKHGDYTVAIKVGENLLRRKPDYRPILKIVGFSSYMIGLYERAQAALSKYKKLEPKDPEVDFILGLITFEKGDYETSNIYFNNAVLGGYKPKIVVERKLAYNYFTLGLKKNMFQVLGYLVLEPDVTAGDMSNAVYLALTYDEVRTAGEWLKQANEKFPKSLDLMALSAWHLRITGKIAEAQNLLTTIREKNPNHLLALIESGINAYNAGEKTTAKEYMKKAKIINAGGTWTETIEAYLAKL